MVEIISKDIQFMLSGLIVMLGLANQDFWLGARRYQSVNSLKVINHDFSKIDNQFQSTI